MAQFLLSRTTALISQQAAEVSSSTGELDRMQALRPSSDQHLCRREERDSKADRYLEGELVVGGRVSGTIKLVSV